MSVPILLLVAQLGVVNYVESQGYNQAQAVAVAESVLVEHDQVPESLRDLLDRVNAEVAKHPRQQRRTSILGLTDMDVPPDEVQP
jgi:hypothetical protein